MFTFQTRAKGKDSRSSEQIFFVIREINIIFRTFGIIFIILKYHELDPISICYLFRCLRVAECRLGFPSRGAG